MQHHYDADGNLTGTTVTESPWDDHSHGEALALYEIQANRHQCGHDLDEATDPNTIAVVESFVCAYCRAVAQVERRQREQHDEAWADGRFWYARPYDPERDKGKTRQRVMDASPSNGRSSPKRMSRR